MIIYYWFGLVVWQKGGNNMFLKSFWYWLTGKKKEKAIEPIKNPTNANLQDDLKNIRNKYPNNDYISQNEYPDERHQNNSSGLLTGMMLGEILNETMRSRHHDNLDNDFDDGFDDSFGGGSSGGGGADDSWDSDSFSDDSDFDDD